MLLPHLSLIRLTGPDVTNFLQGQLTCDVKNLPAQTAQLGGYCNIQGRLMAVFYITHLEQDIGLILPSSIATSVITLLEKYGRFSRTRCTLEPTPLYGNLSLQDDKIGTTIALPGLPHRRLSLTPLFTNETLQDWQAMDIAQQIPWIYPETQDMFLPHHINLPTLGGVAFDKGCYLGQEIIARMHYRGQIRKHPYTIQGQGPFPIPGTPVIGTNGPVGAILFAQANTVGFTALACLVDESITQPLQVNDHPIALQP